MKLPYRLLKQYPFSLVNEHIIDYPTPTNFNYFWGFGSLAGLFLSFQIVTGVFLAMHYTPHVLYAFDSLEHIMRDVNYGWLLRYAHSTGASVFFILVYIHIARGLYYGSYLGPRERVWSIGIVIFILMMAAAFMGYVLPWGQMSFWGATVITNLFTAVPILGESIAYWLWGGFAVENATLNRFFSLHYLVPFLILGMVVLHLSLLHSSGSGNPLGICSPGNLAFYPYFYIKDLFGLVVCCGLFSMVLFFAPNFLGHPDNYIEANILVTPAHIVPEWYFLPFYAILRSIPSKLVGVIALFLSIVVIWALPFFVRWSVYSARFRFVFQVLFWFLMFDVALLGWLGACPVEIPYVQIGQCASVSYFLGFLVLMPMLGRIDIEVLLDSNRT